MELHEHVRITADALKRWLIAQTQDALAVGALWLAGLLLIGVPGAPFWAVLGAFFQFIPHIGPVLSLIGPAIAGAVALGWMGLFYVLILYAVIVVIDGLVLQPIFMKRTARVPIWASLLTPLVLGLLLNVWGVILSAPLLAIIWAYRARNRAATTTRPAPPGVIDIHAEHIPDEPDPPPSLDSPDSPLPPPSSRT